MVQDVMMNISSLGIAGLLFVMWWWERQDRVRIASGMQEAVSVAQQMKDVNRELVQVLQRNTEALGALRTELITHREAEMDWLRRLGRQVEALERAV